MKRPLKHDEEFWEISGCDDGPDESLRAILHWLDRELPLEQTLEQILEAGCDRGRFSPHLARRTHRLRSCDASSSQIAANCRNHPDISFFVQDLSTPLAAEANTFNAVWCSDALARMITPAYAINEFYRVLKPNGKLLITVPSHGFLKKLSVALFRWDSYFAPDTPYTRFFTIKTLTQTVKKTGFRNIHVETGGGFTPSQLLLSAKK